MYLISVNIGRPRYLPRGRNTGEITGIFKEPALGPVAITQDGVDGDAICDTRHHGGPDQAVYVYGSVDYDWWAQELGRTLEPGTFGENLTIHGLESARFSVGDRLQVGSVVLEVTAPRIPCGTFGARMGDPTFPERFRAAERPGLYCRVILPGVVQAGDPVAWEPYAGATVTILEMFRDFYRKDLSEADLRRYLAAPIAARDRMAKEKALARLQAVRRGMA